MAEAVKLYITQIEDSYYGLSAEVFFTWEEAVAYVKNDIKESLVEEWDEEEEECALDDYAEECEPMLESDIYKEPRTGRVYGISIIPVPVDKIKEAIGEK